MIYHITLILSVIQRNDFIVLIKRILKKESRKLSSFLRLLIYYNNNSLFSLLLPYFVIILIVFMRIIIIWNISSLKSYVCKQKNYRRIDVCNSWLSERCPCSISSINFTIYYLYIQHAGRIISDALFFAHV